MTSATNEVQIGSADTVHNSIDLDPDSILNIYYQMNTCVITYLILRIVINYYSALLSHHTCTVHTVHIYVYINVHVLYRIVGNFRKCKFSYD